MVLVIIFRFMVERIVNNLFLIDIYVNCDILDVVFSKVNLIKKLFAIKSWLPHQRTSFTLMLFFAYYLAQGCVQPD